MKTWIMYLPPNKSVIDNETGDTKHTQIQRHRRIGTKLGLDFRLGTLPQNRETIESRFTEN